MADSYQAIYDAVRSRISGGNIADAVQSVLRDCFDISYAREAIVQDLHGAIVTVTEAMQRPSVLFRPVLSADGIAWCALLGPDLQTGLAGFGATPAEAMAAFDRAFLGASDKPPFEPAETIVP